MLPGSQSNLKPLLGRLPLAPRMMITGLKVAEVVDLEGPATINSSLLAI